MSTGKAKLAVSMLLIVFTSCLNESADSLPRTPSRTILFYMAGDNSLRDETQDKINALAEAWAVEGDNHLLVYQDCGVSPRLLEIKSGADGKGMVQVLAEYDNENSAAPHIFSRVLNDMTHLYPGCDYGLIMFSHSTGWLPKGTFTHPYSVAEDMGREMELPEFAEVIPNGMFRFIIFESCLMAGVEVAYELKDKTEYILASSAEILSPGFTPLYDKMLACLYKFTPALEEFAGDYVEYRQGLSGDARSATVSVLRPSELVPLKPLLAQVEYNISHWEWLDRTGIQYFDRRINNHLYYDLEGYIREAGTQKQINEFASILKKIVIYKASTDKFMRNTQYGYEIKQHCGLTIYIPVAKYQYLNEYRKKLRLYDPAMP